MAVLNRLIAVLLGLALLATGVVLLVETVVVAAGRPPLLADRARLNARLSELTWTDMELDVVLVSLIVLGLLLLVVQVWPRQPYALPLRGKPDRRGEVERKPLAGLLAARAERDSDVVRAMAKVTRRKAELRAWAVPGADVAAVRERLGDELRDSVDAFELARPMGTRVSVLRARERTR